MDPFDRAMSLMGSNDGGTKRERKVSTKEEPAMKRRMETTTAPPRIFSTPTSAAPAGRESFAAIEHIDVQMNMFPISIVRMPPRLQRLCFETTLVLPDGKSFNLNTGLVAVSGDVNSHNRRLAQHTIFRKFLDKNRHLFGNKDHHYVVYDCAATIYVPDGYYSGGEEVKFELRRDDFREDEWERVSKLCRKRGCYFSIKMTPTGFVYTSGENLLETSNRMELTRCIEIVTSQYLNSPDFYQFGNATFPLKQRPVSEPDSVTEVRPGFAKVARLVDGRMGRNEMLITIDTKFSPFYKNITVLKFIVSKYEDLKGSRGGGGRIGGGRDDHRGGYGGHGGRGDYRDSGRGRGGGYGRDNYRHANDSFGGGDSMRSEPSSREIEEVQKGISEGGSLRSAIEASMKGLYAEATHMPKDSNRIVVITGIADSNAENTVFTMKDENGEREISVADYFVEKYNYRLKYPRMPLVFSMRLKHANYYPVELLKIIPGQRIKMSKMTVTVQSAMTSRNSSMPRQHVELVQKILHESLRLERNPYMDAFGIELESTNLIQLKAKILPPAQIRFKDQAYLPRPRSVAFRTQAKFVNPARLKSIAIIIFDHAIDERQAGGFCEALHRYCRDQGISVMEDHRKWQIKEMRSCDNSEIKRKMERYRDEKVDILIGICQEKRPDVHDVLKYYEEACGMQTIQLCSQTVNKMMSQQGGRQTIDNVMRKFNLKCGGTNFHVDIPQECMGRSVCSNNETLRRKLFEHTQFIGFEISHGASRTLYNRAHGQMDGDPSVVGVSYSLTNSTELGGFTYLQTSREYKLQNLEKKFPECVNAYKEHAKRLPSKIVVYRVGMGEGDIKRLKEEIEEIRSTFDKIQPGYRPHLIVIVAQKNSHTRVFPARIEGHKAGEQNVPSGTCLDNGITSFGAEEFILVSQTPLIGTVRPCKYTILENDPKWTKNEISHLTYFRAFGHQVSYQPPSVPDVLYAAENLAKRGRNNWIVHKKMDNMQDVERKILKRYPELDTEEMRDELAAAIITDMSERMNGMTIMKRNFWA